MQYGICPLALVPVRPNPSPEDAMNSQLLYGESFKILEERKYWYRIRAQVDQVEGWIQKNQTLLITESNFEKLRKEESVLTTELFSFIALTNHALMPIVIGSEITNDIVPHHIHEGETTSGLRDREFLIDCAMLYLNAPEIAGGKSPLGIDSAGFVQMVYKLAGIALPRRVEEQTQEGESLSFIEESEIGDLAFFDNKEGKIHHVGLILQDNHIIHCHGHVRIDRIDHTGIFNNELRNYTHQLRVIKKIMP
jgi:hypothetical protein